MLCFLDGLRKLETMAQQRPGNAMVLAYARRLEREAKTLSEGQLLEGVFRTCGLEFRKVKMPPVPAPYGGYLLGEREVRMGVKWAEQPQSS